MHLLHIFPLLPPHALVVLLVLDGLLQVADLVHEVLLGLLEGLRVLVAADLQCGVQLV